MRSELNWSDINHHAHPPPPPPPVHQGRRACLHLFFFFFQGRALRRTLHFPLILFQPHTKRGKWFELPKVDYVCVYYCHGFCSQNLSAIVTFNLGSDDWRYTLRCSRWIPTWLDLDSASRMHLATICILEPDVRSLSVVFLTCWNRLKVAWSPVFQGWMVGFAPFIWR